MTTIKLKDLTNDQIIEMVDEKVPYILLPNFRPNAVQEWWTTNIQLSKEKLINVEVRDMTFDLLTDASTLKMIFKEVRFTQLLLYQFAKRPAANLKSDYLPDASRNKILIQNGLINRIWINYEFIEFSSTKEDYLNSMIEKYASYLV
jgi:hypothetical protein